MFTFSNSTLSQSYSIKPKKETNSDYVNISNDNNKEANILPINLKAINFENISVELALNVLQLKHNNYHEMSQYDIIQYYNDKMKLTNNINIILALKIILKAKLKGLDVKINKHNVMTFSDTNENNKITTDNTFNEKKKEINKNDTLDNEDNTKNDFKINQFQNNSFKIIQNNI